MYSWSYFSANEHRRRVNVFIVGGATPWMEVEKDIKQKYIKYVQ